MIIVGVGVGPGMLTEEAIEAIKNAPVVYGSPRALELAGKYIECESHIIENYKALHQLPADTVILSTGDPMFSGLGSFAKEGDIIIPGISSIQVACSRLGVKLANLVAITAHGRDPAPARDALIKQLELGKDIFLLPADFFGSVEVAGILKDMGINADIYVCENFGYPEERIAKGTIDEPPISDEPLRCVLIVR